MMAFVQSEPVAVSVNTVVVLELYYDSYCCCKNGRQQTPYRRSRVEITGNEVCHFFKNIAKKLEIIPNIINTKQSIYILGNIDARSLTNSCQK